MEKWTDDEENVWYKEVVTSTFGLGKSGKTQELDEIWELVYAEIGQYDPPKFHWSSLAHRAKHRFMIIGAIITFRYARSNTLSVCIFHPTPLTECGSTSRTVQNLRAAA